MARYIDWAYVNNKYPAFSDMAGAEDQGDRWIGQAENEVDGWLAPKYSVPFSSNVPGIVQDLSADVAYYKGLLLKNSEQAESLWSYIELRLKALNDGTMALTTSDGIVSRAAGGSWNSHEDYHGSFGVTDPVEWSVSSQWKSDEAFDRGG